MTASTLKVRTRNILGTAVIVLGAIGTVALGLISALPELWIPLVVVALVFIGSAACMQVWLVHADNKLARTLESEVRLLRQKTRDALQPIVELIGKIPALDAEERSKHLQVIAQACAGALYMLISPHCGNMRANVFALREGPDRLEWLAHVGRGVTPKPLIAGTPRGESALKFITDLQPRLYKNLRQEKPPGYEGSMSDYETFLAVPVWSDQSVHGMVTVDAPRAGELDETDLQLAELIAELMATAFAVANKQR